MIVRVIHRPPGGEQREWELDPDSLLTVDAEAVELLGGQSWEDYDEWKRLLRKGNRRALRAALWVVRHHDEPGLTFEALDLRADEVKFDLIGETERARWRQRLIDGEVSDPEIRAFMVEMLGEDPTAGDPKAEQSDSQPPSTD